MVKSMSAMGDATKLTSEIDAILAEAVVVTDQAFPELEFDPADFEIEFDPYIFDFGPGRTLPPPASPAHTPPALTGTRKISLRVPARILAALKVRAAATGVPYQRLLNQALQNAVRSWEAPA